MNLKKKRELIARTLKVGKGRIRIDETSINEIKEAITRQDIKELKSKKIIKTKEKGGRKKKEKRKTKRRKGSKKKKINTRKQDYVKLTRKLREYIKNLKNKEQLDKEQYRDLRKKIRAKNFKSLAHLKEFIRSYKK